MDGMRGLSDSIPGAPVQMTRQHRAGQHERSQPVPTHADAAKHRVAKLHTHDITGHSGPRARKGRSTMKRVL